MKSYIYLINFLIVFGTSKTNNCSQRNKCNVLLVIVDDLRFLSDAETILPNINKLAAKCTKFKNAYAQQALCAPSRNSMLTGRRPDSLRLYDFYSYWRTSVGNFTTFPQYLKENGYDTFSVGKIFHPGISSNYTDDFPYSWSQKPFHPSTEKYKDASICKNRFSNELHSNLICPVNLKNVTDNTLPDLQSLQYGIDIILQRNSSSKPFLLGIGFHKPHIPLKFPHKYLHKVLLHKVRPPSFPHRPIDLPSVAWHPWTDVRRRDDIKKLKIKFPFGEMPTKWTLKIRQAYYAAAMYIDDLVGQLLSYVNWNNTIVVLTSDHGWSLGENGLWAKYSNFDVALKVPLLISVPGLTHKIIKSPVELVDIFPTIVDLVGLSSNISKCQYSDNSSLCFDGESLEPLMHSTKNRRTNKYAFSQYPRPSVYPRKNSDKPRLKDIKIMGYSIKTQKYRYTEWISFNNTVFTRNWDKRFGLELYDHIIDPNETQNLHFSPKYERIRGKLSKLLKSKVESSQNEQLFTEVI